MFLFGFLSLAVPRVVFVLQGKFLYELVYYWTKKKKKKKRKQLVATFKSLLKDFPVGLLVQMM